MPSSKYLFVIAGFSVCVLSSSAAFAWPWSLWAWKRKYPQFTVVQVEGEDYDYTKLLATNAAHNRCIDTFGGQPYGEPFVDCVNKGRVIYTVVCTAHYPCEQ